MASKSERKDHRREMIKAITHTHLKSNKSATAKELEMLINEDKLLRSSVSAEQISNILSRATVNNSSQKRFKTDKGVWRLNV